MRRIVALAAVLTLSGSPGQAQGEAEDGLDLIGRGMQMFLEGLMEQVEPAMRGLAETLDEWELEGFDLQELRNYQSPEMLPNGDIILRRKPDAPPFEPSPEPLPDAGDEVEI